MKGDFMIRKWGDFHNIGIRAKNKISYLFIQMLRNILARKNFILIREMAALEIQRQIPINATLYPDLDFIRISTLELVSNEIKEQGLSGAIAELGVYNGGFAKYLNQLFPEKKLYLFDTFSGFDKRDWEYELSIGTNAVYQDFKVDLIQDCLKNMPYREKCIIKQGYFPESLDGLEETFCFVSIDVDLYQPILKGLEYFYPRLIPGGYIFVHDYNQACYKGAKRAVREYCRKERIPYFPLSDYGGSAIISKG
jgi:O-methyltransferase